MGNSISSPCAALSQAHAAHYAARERRLCKATHHEGPGEIPERILVGVQSTQALQDCHHNCSTQSFLRTQ